MIRNCSYRECDMTYIIYIAEDDVQLGRYLEKVATRCGWSVTVCGDGLELASRLKKETALSLALIDVQMPHMNGIEVINALFDFRHRLRLRFMSGGPLADTIAARMIADGRDMSVGRTIYKPIMLDEWIDLFESEKIELDKLTGPNRKISTADGLSVRFERRRP